MAYSPEFEKWNPSCKIIRTNHLLALCEMLDDYQSFDDDLEKLIQSKRKKNLVKKAYCAMQNKHFLGFNKYKEFIKKHQRTIEIMNQYSCLSNLTVLSYDAKGRRRENLSEDYFYQYLQEKKEDIENIKAVALKVKDLGIDTIHFAENLDFTEMEYKLDTFSKTPFLFLENIEVNPTYLKSPIHYRTTDSCYCFLLKTNGFGNDKEISKYDRDIVLNRLAFDPDRLPNEITVASTIGVILKQAEKKKIEYEGIKYSVDLSISIYDLKNYFEHLKEVTQRNDTIKDNPAFVNLFQQLQDTLIQLQLFGDNFESKMMDAYPDITTKTMQKEKKLYLDRRYRDSIDID